MLSRGLTHSTAHPAHRLVSCHLALARAKSKTLHFAAHSPSAQQRCPAKCQAGSIPDDGALRRADADKLFRSIQQDRREIGSEYGQGFVQFPTSGGATHLDVDTLNEKLRSNGAIRHRHALCPDEAHACIFSLDDVIVDTRGMQRRAWQRLAAEEDLPFPTVERQLYDVRPERVVTEVLQWTQEWARAQELAFRVASIFAEEVLLVTEALPGVTSWLRALRTARVPCALVSQMPAALLKELLSKLDLQHTFEARVTAEDGTETIAEALLSAAFKLQRPPNQCVVFDSSPSGVAAAHNCTMKAVALQGAHRGYQLQQADMTCSNFSELTVYNIRRLFALRGYELMDLSTATPTHKPPMRRTMNGVADPA